MNEQTKQPIVEKQVLLDLIKQSKSQLEPRLTSLISTAKRAIESIKEIEFSWSGSFLGYHHELYYKEFEKPPLGSRFNPEWGGIRGIKEGWKVRSPNEVRDAIESKAAVNIQECEEEQKLILEAAETLRSKLLVSLAPIQLKKEFEQEAKLISELEKFEWGIKRNRYINERLPGRYMSRDSRAVAEGPKLPTHLFYEAVMTEISTSCESIRDFWRQAETTVERIQAKEEALQKGFIFSSESEKTHKRPAIIDRRIIVAIIGGAALIIAAFVSRPTWQQSDPVREKPKVEQALHRFFNAIANYDYQGLRNACTADYQLIEDGSLWTVDTLIEAIKPMEGKVKIIYAFENINARIEGSIAWLTYKNKAVLTSKDGEENLEWAESAVFQKENNVWKMALLHSTRLKTKEEK